MTRWVFVVLLSLVTIAEIGFCVDVPPDSSNEANLVATPTSVELDLLANLTDTGGLIPADDGSMGNELGGQRSEEDEEGEKYAEIHMHPHPPVVKYPTLKTVMRFTYGEEDELGPNNWDLAPSAILTTNDCPNNKFTPLNINTSMSGLAEQDNSHFSSSTNEEASLSFFSSAKIGHIGYEFGFPQDTFNGIAITPNAYGTFQVMDEYDSHEKEAGTASRMYDFTFALVTFCDLDRSSPNRSGHQLDGERFPFEIHFLFFGFFLQIGIDRTVFGEKRNDIVMVSVLGRISEDDNPVLAPLITAARNFNGSDYSDEFGDDTVTIPGPFSPLTLFPKGSGYFYYKGNFPIPPCFSIPRVYVLDKPISISRKQLSVLTSMKSKREPSGVMTCVYGNLPEELDRYSVQYNPTPIHFNSRHVKESVSGVPSTTPFPPIILAIFPILFNIS